MREPGRHDRFSHNGSTLPCLFIKCAETAGADSHTPGDAVEDNCHSLYVWLEFTVRLLI